MFFEPCRLKDVPRPADPTPQTAKERLCKVPDDIASDPVTRACFVKTKGSQSDPMQTKALSPYFRGPVEVWPGLMSVHPDFMKFRSSFARQASKDFEPHVDEQGFADESRVTTNFSALHTCAGLKMDRANAPMASQKELHEIHGIAQNFVCEEDEIIYREVHRAIFGHRVPDVPFHFSKVSSTSMPWHDAGGTPMSHRKKKQWIEFLLDHADDIFTLIANHDLEGLYHKYAILLAYFTGERAQAEGGKYDEKGNLIPKDRPVSTREYALGLVGADQGIVVADKQQWLKQYYGIEDGVAARIRTVYGLAFAISALYSCLLAGSREHYYNVFAYTWHHTGTRSLDEAVATFEDVLGVDVSNHDQYFPTWILDKSAEWMSDYYDDRITAFLKLLNRAPYFAAQTTPGDTPFWMGNPFDEDTFDVCLGLASGRSDVAENGKWYMTSNYIILMKNYGIDVLNWRPTVRESIEGILKGEHPAFGIKNMGDDCIIGLRKGYEHLAPRIRADLKKAGEAKLASVVPYCIIDLENGVAFLGSVLAKDKEGNRLPAGANPVTFFVNRHCPEHSIRSKHRKWWHIGYMAAKEHYMSAGPIMHELLDMETFFWQKHLPGFDTPNQMAHRFAQGDGAPQFETLSVIDMQVLVDPSKRFYRYTAADISPEVMDLFSGTIDGELISRKLKFFFKR